MNKVCLGPHLLSTMCGSRKYPFPPHERSLEIPREEGGGGMGS